MRTGVIVYIAGHVPDGWDEDRCEAIKRLGIQIDMVEVVISKLGSYDIHDAWWKLISKGVQNITCKLAVVDSSENLKLTGKELRLCG